MIWIAVTVLFLLLLWESRRVSQSLKNMAKYGDDAVADLKRQIEELREQIKSK